MHTFANKQDLTNEVKSKSTMIPRQTISGQNRDVSSLLQLQRSIGNQSVHQLVETTNSEDIKAGLSTTTPTHFAHDYKQTPVFTHHDEMSPTVCQNQFKTWGSAGGLSGLTLDVTFSVSKTPAASLQVIQTVMATGGPQKVGAYRWKWKGKTWDAFVDGGKNSPFVTISGNTPAHPTKPYYLTPAEVTSQVSFATDSGTIRVFDRPGAAALWDQVHFETAIVAVDYKGKKKDKILKAFKWGWRGKGTKPTVKKGTKIAGTHSGVSVRSGVSPEFRNIVKNDYPKYKFS